MMLRTLALGTAILGLSIAAVPVGAEESPLPPLVCEFKDGFSSSYENGSFKAKPPQPLSFVIEKIDLEGQTAVLRAAGAEGKLSVVRAINANHFIEAVTEGFLNLTTIYDKDAETGLYPAVHSRHFGLLGQPVIGQYTGACRAE